MLNNDFLAKVRKNKISEVSGGLKSALTKFSNFTNNIQKETYIAVGGMKKSGKTAFVDFYYLLMPYILNPTAKIKWFYFSGEISRIKKMAKFAAFFMLFKYNKIVTPAYILSLGNNKISDDDEKLVQEIYSNELVDLFGVWDSRGKLIKEGKIYFCEDKVNPTAIRSILLTHFYANGELIYDTYVVDGVTKKKMIGYTENDEELYTVCITDHVGLLKKERGYTKKDNIDKHSEYMVFFRNIFKLTIIDVSQFNRDLGKIDRLKFSGDALSPTAEDFKDTGNLAENVNLLLALFNPSSMKHIRTHLGYNIDKLQNRYVSLHILEARDTEGFIDLGLNFVGECGAYKELPNIENITNTQYNEIVDNQYILKN